MAQAPTGREAPAKPTPQAQSGSQAKATAQPTPQAQPGPQAKATAQPTPQVQSGSQPKSRPASARHMTELGGALEDRGLQQYARALDEMGFTTVSSLLRLPARKLDGVLDLIKLLPGHRVRLLNSVEEMRAHRILDDAPRRGSADAGNSQPLPKATPKPPDRATQIASAYGGPKSKSRPGLGGTRVRTPGGSALMTPRGAQTTTRDQARPSSRASQALDDLEAELARSEAEALAFLRRSWKEDQAAKLDLSLVFTEEGLIPLGEIVVPDAYEAPINFAHSRFRKLALTTLMEYDEEEDELSRSRGGGPLMDSATTADLSRAFSAAAISSPAVTTGTAVATGTSITTGTPGTTGTAGATGTSETTGTSSSKSLSSSDLRRQLLSEHSDLVVAAVAAATYSLSSTPRAEGEEAAIVPDETPTSYRSFDVEAMVAALGQSEEEGEEGDEPEPTESPRECAVGAQPWIPQASNSSLQEQQHPRTPPGCKSGDIKKSILKQQQQK